MPPTATSEPAPDVSPDGAPPTTAAPNRDDRPQGFAGARLRFFDECDGLLGYLRTEALERVTPWGLASHHPHVVARTATMDVAAEEMADDASAVDAPAAGVDFSETNTQEVGVDEGDIVETDGRFVYTLDHETLRIVSVDTADVVAEEDLPSGDQQMLLADDRLLVVSQTWDGDADSIVSTYDVSDPTAPELLRRRHFEGSVLATRAADGIARLVITTSLHTRLPFVMPSEFGHDEDSALERNRQIIESSAIDDWLPRWFDEGADGSFGPMNPALGCEHVAAPRDFAGLGITWIASVELATGTDPVGSAGVVSNGDEVYASSDHLYIATRDWDLGFVEWEPRMVDERSTGSPEDDGPPPTLIHQFALGDGTDAVYVASGEVEGYLLNQFAMSEHNGDLRVATTDEDWRFGTRSDSTVWVLRPENGELKVISSVGGLGEGERIYAVRFLGDTGYVVTFRQIDPLYVLDLSDPESPVLEGELKIPGYSAYLHPVGEDLLLGVGQDATRRGRARGTQLSLFDVSDPTDPQRIDTLAVGGWSDVEWDHRAFLFWEPDGTIVLPVSPGWNDCPADTTCPASEISGPGGGAVVAELDGRTLAVRGVIDHESSRRRGCWNPLQRSIAIGDELVTVAPDQMQFSDRETLERRDGVKWGDPDDYDCWWYWD